MRYGSRWGNALCVMVRVEGILVRYGSRCGNAMRVSVRFAVMFARRGSALREALRRGGFEGVYFEALTALAEYCCFLPHITVQNDMREEKICLKKTRGIILSAGLS